MEQKNGTNTGAGRMAQDPKEYEETQEMQEIVSDMLRSSLVRKWNELYQVKTYGEMSPTDIVPVIASNRNRQRAVFPMKWGFTGKTLLMNARVETAAVKPTFKDAWTSHRCIVPASYYFEWEHLIGNNGKTRTGDKYAIPLDFSVNLC